MEINYYYLSLVIWSNFFTVSGSYSVPRSLGEHTGTTQGPNICPQVEQEGKLHSECWCRQGRCNVGTGSVGYWAPKKTP